MDTKETQRFQCMHEIQKEKMNIWWDRCNKWLYIGTKEGQSNQIVLMFDNWMNWISRRALTIREWSLFQIMWDNGAFWADLADVTEFSVPHMNGKNIETENYIKRSGTLPCFFQVVILGIGIRYQYEKNMMVIHRGRTND